MPKYRIEIHKPSGAVKEKPCPDTVTTYSQALEHEEKIAARYPKCWTHIRES